MSSTGTIDLQLELLAHAGVDDRDRARAPLALPVDGPAAEEAGDLVERTLGRGEPDALGRTASRAARSSRSSDSARWAPRLVAAIAWISSTITCSTDARISRALDVSIR